jgi:DNA-binding protein YbaB
MQPPDDAAMQRIMADVQNALGDVVATQRRLIEVSGTAWSEDRLVRVVVGPRGQLVELEIDPRLGNRPNMAALAQTILATARAATEEAMARSREILNQGLPDPGAVRDTAVPGGLDLTDLLLSSDSDLYRMARGDDDGDR